MGRCDGLIRYGTDWMSSTTARSSAASARLGDRTATTSSQPGILPPAPCRSPTSIHRTDHGDAVLIARLHFERRPLVTPSTHRTIKAPQALNSIEARRDGGRAATPRQSIGPTRHPVPSREAAVASRIRGHSDTRDRRPFVHKFSVLAPTSRRKSEQFGTRFFPSFGIQGCHSPFAKEVRGGRPTT